MDTFPTVYWQAWDADATFLPGDELPPDSQGRLYAVLVFLFYGDKVALADIAGRGYCIPSGRIEPGETLDAAAEREVWEETGGRLAPDRRRLIGCYRLVARADPSPESVRWCPVFVAEALGFEPIPPGSEFQGLFLAAIEDVADLYFTWDPLMAAVFAYADAQKKALLPIGTRLSDLRLLPSDVTRSELTTLSCVFASRLPTRTIFRPPRRATSTFGWGRLIRRPVPVVRRLKHRQQAQAVGVAQHGHFLAPVLGHARRLPVEARRQERRLQDREPDLGRRRHRLLRCWTAARARWGPAAGRRSARSGAGRK